MQESVVDVPVVLVGNKTDQWGDRMVSLEDGQRRSKEIGCVCFHEISVRESIEQVRYVDDTTNIPYIERSPSLEAKGIIKRHTLPNTILPQAQVFFWRSSSTVKNVYVIVLIYVWNYPISFYIKTTYGSGNFSNNCHRKLL